MAFIVKLKKFYKLWLEPPGIRQWRERIQQPNQQKYWNGENVPAPPLEMQYFRALGFDAWTITRRDDSRPCVLISRLIELPIPEGAAGDFIQIAVTADRWNPTSSVTFRVEGSAVTHTHLKEGYWLDVRLPSVVGARKLTIVAGQALWVSYPRIVHQLPVTDCGSRHVIVMVLDGWARRRFDSQHPTEPGRKLTPNLDRFFAEGFHAPNGFSSSEWTLPASASFFTGKYASRHQMVNPVLPMRYKSDEKLLAEYFQQAGYQTLGLSCGSRLTPAFGSHRGFDRFIYHWANEGRTTFDYDPVVWINEIVAHIDAHRLGKTFTYVHFPDTHPAWNLSPITRAFNLSRRGCSTGHDFDRLENSKLGREQGRQIMLLRLREFDRAIESLLGYVEEYHSDNVIVTLTADHGTPWPDFHDTHTRDTPPLNELRTGTFIQMKGRGVPNQLCTTPVSPNLDLMPTLLNLAGIKVSEVFDGKDLFSAGAKREYVISESIFRGVYEVAINDLNRQWIKRFPIDEKLFQITGPAFYQGGFPTNCTDYSTPVFTEDSVGDRLIDEHLRLLGLTSV